MGRRIFWGLKASGHRLRVTDFPMRILFTFMGGSGHFLPMLPVARAAAAAGHAVMVGCGPSMQPIVRQTGLPVRPFGTGPAEPPERRPLRPLDAAREDEEFRLNFAERGTGMRVDQARAACEEWRPDVLVCEEADFGSMLAAELSGRPYANLLVMAAGSFVRPELVGGTLNARRAQYGLPPDPAMIMLRRHLVLSPFPPGFRDPAYPLPPNAFSFRGQGAVQAGEPGPQWTGMRPGSRLIYFTLGTVFSLEAGDLFERAVGGLRQLDCNLLVTVGEHIDPAELGVQPPHVRVERFVAQDLVLPHCSLVISHGGSGSLTGSLAYGLPSVLIPMGADQISNSARAVQLGLARQLDPVEASSQEIRAAAAAVLDDPAYRRSAELLGEEYARLPKPADVIPLLEQLAVP